MIQLMMWLLTLVKATNTAETWFRSLPPEKQAIVSDIAWSLFQKAVKHLLASELEVVQRAFTARTGGN